VAEIRKLNSEKHLWQRRKNAMLFGTSVAPSAYHDIGFLVKSVAKCGEARVRDDVMILGDSVTVGAGFSGVSRDNSYVSLLRRQFTRAGVQAELKPSALDGVDTDYALKRFDRMVGRERPDVLVIALGLNDARPPGGRVECPPDRYKENLCRLAEKAMEIDARPVLCTPSPRLDVSRDGQPGWQAMAPYAEKVRSVADTYHLPWIDLYEEFVAREDLDDLLPDRLHPGPVGHRMIARLFARTLIPICRSGRFAATV